MCPNDFLSQSKELLGMYDTNGCKEVDLRSAISRAYYSLFHNALRYLESNFKAEFDSQYRIYAKGPKTSDSEKGAFIHRVIPNTLNTINIKNSRVLGVKFKSYRDLRNKADYKLDMEFIRGDVEQEINSMENLMSQIKALND